MGTRGSGILNLDPHFYHFLTTLSTLSSFSFTLTTEGHESRVGADGRLVSSSLHTHQYFAIDGWRLAARLAEAAAGPAIRLHTSSAVRRSVYRTPGGAAAAGRSPGSTVPTGPRQEARCPQGVDSVILPTPGIMLSGLSSRPLAVPHAPAALILASSHLPLNTDVHRPPSPVASGAQPSSSPHPSEKRPGPRPLLPSPSPQWHRVPPSGVVESGVDSGVDSGVFVPC